MIQRYGRFGTVDRNSSAVLSFEMIAATDTVSIEEDKAKYNAFQLHGDYFTFGDHTVATYGADNRLPNEVQTLIRNNHILPEILKKQVRMLYGQGAFLFREEESEDGIKRIPVSALYPQVFEWLDSWERMGIENSVEEYIIQSMTEYYYTEGIPTKWLYTRARRLSSRSSGQLPVLGLEHIPSTRFRFAVPGVRDVSEFYERKDFTHAMVGRWDLPFKDRMEVFPLLDKRDPLKHNVAISYVSDMSFGDSIYSFPTFYFGLKEWIKGSNINPKYINSYLRNSLNAKLHVLIPDKWISNKEATIKKVCDTNQERDQAGKPLITEYEGLKDIGTVFDFSMVQKLIDIKLNELTEVLSGAGENQGKAFYSRKFRTEYGIEEWEFKEIPTKYKEFISSIIDFDKRAVEVILEGKGLDPSISNVTGKGMFQGSGSQSYYNYIIYLNSLNYAEYFALRDLNRALYINFPQLERDRVKLGTFRRIPERQKEISSDDRLENTSN